MQIYFERTGGLVPRALKFAATSETLQAAEEQRVRELIETAGFFKLPAAVVPLSQGADRFQYRVTIDDEGRRHTVEFTDPVPADLTPLVHWLTAAARKR
jgi:hypothetical protein